MSTKTTYSFFNLGQTRVHTKSQISQSNHAVAASHDHAGHGRTHEVAVSDGPGHPGLGLQGLEHGGDELLAWEKGVLFGGHWLIMT